MRFHETEEEALRDVTDAIASAQKDGKWMVAVWSTGGGKVTLHTRTTHQFPHDDFLNAVYLLAETMVTEREPQKPAPLPRANLGVARANLGVANIGNILSEGGL